MRQKFNYTSVNTILSKFNRDLRGNDISESDIIEWAGEALGFMKIVEIQEEALAFIEVKNYQAELPDGFQYIVQIARNNRWVPPQEESLSGICPQEIIQSLVNTSQQEVIEAPCNILQNAVCTDCHGGLIGEVELAYYRPFFDLKYEYSLWMSSSLYRNSYTPVRLANHTFMGSLVADELPENKKNLYDAVRDEYTLVGGFPNLALRFSFEKGLVAVSYVRAMIDEETGYPLIPDDSSFLSAITYYVKWKASERLRWLGREGFATEAADAEKHWLKYVRQALNKAKMPQGVDDYQDILEESMYLIPRHKKYYGYFGKLGREENRIFNNPDERKRFTQSRYGRY